LESAELILPGFFPFRSSNSLPNRLISQVEVVLTDIKNLKIKKARVMNGLVTEFWLAA
jgi:hypothetical protein